MAEKSEAPTATMSAQKKAEGQRGRIMSSDLNQTVQDSAKEAAESKFTSEALETKAGSEAKEKERIEAEREIVAEAEDKSREVAEEQHIRLAEEEKRKVGLLIISFMLYFIGSFLFTCFFYPLCRICVRLTGGRS